MKLIDILVQELPKRGGWPVGATCIKQGDISGRIFQDRYNGQELFITPLIATDATTGFVTQSQYEAALAASKLPVWDGEGLPPVGCECERSWCGDKWLKCKVLFVGEHAVVVKIATREPCYDITSVRFRPIRTEAERKREASIAAMREFFGHSSGLYNLSGLYEEIASGKIPGIRLTDDAGSQ